MLSNKIIGQVIERCCFSLYCNNINLQEYIADCIYQFVEVEQNKILARLKPLIEKKVRGAIHTLNDIPDAISFLQSEVLKAYKFRYKYNNGAEWTHIIKSVMNRRLIDFTAKQYRYSRNMYSNGKFVNQSEYLDYYYQQRGHNSKLMEMANKMRSHDQSEFIIQCVIDNMYRFIDIEKEYIENLIYMYNNGYDPLDSNILFGLMGYEKGNYEDKREFNRIKNRVTNKIKSIVMEISREDCACW